MPNTLTYFQATGNWQNLEINLPGEGDIDPHAEDQYPSAFVDIVPRVPAGYTFYVDDLIVQTPLNEIQGLSFDGTPSGGTFKVGTDPSNMSTALAYNANAAAIQAALEALSTIGTGNVIVSGTAPAWQIAFQGALAATNVSTLLTDYSSLSGAILQVSLIRTGRPQRSADTAVHLDPFLARMTNGQLVTPAEEDVPGVYLMSNDPLLNYMNTTVDPPVPAHLIYDVRFRNVVYGPTGIGQLQNFAFEAPVDDTPVNFTDPDFVRLAYAPLPS